MLIDIPTDTAQIIAQIANHQGQSVQDFIIMSAYEKALTLAYTPNQVWHIDNQDISLVQELLDNPPPPNQALKELLALTDNIQDLT